MQAFDEMAGLGTTITRRPLVFLEMFKSTLKPETAHGHTPKETEVDPNSAYRKYTPPKYGTAAKKI